MPPRRRSIASATARRSRAGRVLILTTIDRIKLIMAELDRAMAEPPGEDRDLIQALETLSHGTVPDAIPAPPLDAAPPPATDITVGTLVYQVLERELRPGEVSLDELERAFRETETDEAEFSHKTLAKAGLSQDTLQRSEEEVQAGETSLRGANIRVPIETLEHLMTMVSELVLTATSCSRSSGATRRTPTRRPCSGSRMSRRSCRKAS